ncbi:MAG: beta-glucosidase [Wujia sp.]
MEQQKKLSNLVSEMTLEEKTKMVNGATFFGSYGIDRLGIPRMQLLDGATGMNLEQLFGDITEYKDWSSSEERKKLDGEDAKPVNMIGSTMLVHVIKHYFEPEKLSEEETVLYEWIKKHMDERLHGQDYAPGCYPPGILLGCSFNPDVVRTVGEALGLECCLYGVHFLLGPNVNIHRDARNGRLFEGYSEDPCLVTKLAPEMVKGIQSFGVSATVKHYAANSQETNRVGINEHIARRALEEIYFPGFRACVQEGGTKSVMNAYNQINGQPCTESTWLLLDKLREDFGFNGMIMSDWGAVKHPAEALVGGTNLAMPGPANPKAIEEGVKNGVVSMEKLDAACTRILDVIEWIGEHYHENILEEYSIDRIWEKTNQAAYDAACEGIVMLKNDAACPLSVGTKLAILGSGSRQMEECGSGSAGIDTSRHGDVLREMKAHFKVTDLDEAEYAVVICSVPGMEGNDRKNLLIKEEDARLLEELHAQNKSVVLVLNTCGPVEMERIDTENVKAVFALFLPGMAGAKALADLLVGKKTPSGKLSITFPKHEWDMPSYLNFPGDGFEVTYGEGIYVGYRYYDTKQIAPQYPFGYGLSYTTFACELKAVDCDAKTAKTDVTVSVKNTGNYAGSEVVQVYVQDPYSTLQKPKKELKAFKKIYLQPGEETQIVLTLDRKDFASFDTDLDAFTVEEGYYDILVATSSADADVFGRERIYLDVESPYRYSVDSSVKVIFENKELLTYAYKAWEAEGWDTGIIDNNYEYTAHRTLRDIISDLPEYMRGEDKVRHFAETFEHDIRDVRKC